MKIVTLRKIDAYYWQAEFRTDTRHHVFPSQGAVNTLHNVEILLNHGFQADPALLAQLREEAEPEMDAPSRSD